MPFTIQFALYMRRDAYGGTGDRDNGKRERGDTGSAERMQAGRQADRQVGR